MDRNKEQLLAQLRELFERVISQVRPASSEERFDIELTVSQWRTLVFLKEGPKRMSEIAAYLDVALPTSTAMIDRLVSKQLVERVNDPTDRRIVSCRLTTQGQKALDRFWSIGLKKLENVVAILTLEELEAVLYGIRLLVKAMEQNFTEPQRQQ
jgi:DNA-binding MarR family transcriptional regulator